MIDTELLQRIGWSQELIESVEKMAFSLRQDMDSTTGTQIEVPGFFITEDSSVIDITAITEDNFLWPKF